MKSITDIDEEYIEDAAKAAENGAQKKKRSYRLWAGAVAAAFALCIGIGSIAGGSLRMGSSGSSGYTTATANGFAEYDYDMAAEEEIGRASCRERV